MTRYTSESAYQAALNNPNSIENTMMGGRPPPFNKPTEMSGLQSVQDPNPQSSYAALFEQKFQAGGSEDAIASYLSPIINQAQRQQNQEFDAKVRPYVGEVKQLTDNTFPDLFSGSGMGSLGGLFGGIGMGYGGGMGNGLSGPASDVLSGLLSSSVANSSPASGIGSNPFVQSRKNMGPSQLYKLS